MIKTETYVLPDYWACPLINGDQSGFEDTDVESLGAWIADHPHLGECLDMGESRGLMTHHDAYVYGVLACDCSEFTFPVVDESRRKIGA